jgi:hypothetical protein
MSSPVTTTVQPGEWFKLKFFFKYNSKISFYD